MPPIPSAGVRLADVQIKNGKYVDSTGEDISAAIDAAFVSVFRATFRSLLDKTTRFKTAADALERGDMSLDEALQLTGMDPKKVIVWPTSTTE